MSKLRVHDMAGEFGISSDEVIALLRQMDVPVRSHLSLLTDDQVARVRARWEREKRARAEKQAAPATTTRRRRSTAVAPVPEPAEAAAGDARIRRGSRSEAAPAPLEIAEPTIAPLSDEPNEIAAEATFAVEHETEAPADRVPERGVPYDATAPAIERFAPAPPEEAEPRSPTSSPRAPEESRAPAAQPPAPVRPYAPPST